MDMTWIWLLLLAIIVPMLFLYFTKIRKQKEDIIEPNFIHIFPDYPRSNPCIMKAGDILSFVLKGYVDSECLEEVELKKEDIRWQHQNYVGKFIEQEANIIHYQIPDEPDKQGKIVYISATYHSLKDASWIKIAS